MTEKTKQMLVGIHSISAALNNKGKSLKQIMLTEKSVVKYADILESIAQDKIKIVKKQILDNKTSQPHQGIIAIFETKTKSTNLNKIAEESSLLVLLDQVTDPHNVGAIIRSANAFGAGAVISTSRNSALDSPIIAKASSGAIEETPLIAISNLNSTIKSLQKEGFWVVGLDGYADSEIQETDLKGKVALVMGSEGSGLRKLVKENCDSLIKLPMQGSVESLNVSVACGISLYEYQRQNNL